jgi:hypothetical protein
MTLNCSILNGSQDYNSNKSLRVIYPKQAAKDALCHYEFGLKQQAAMHQGFINQISFVLRDIFSDNEIMFSKTADSTFGGCVEIYN